MGNPVHHDLDGDRNLLFHFLGRAARPLRNDGYVIVGDVGIRFHRQVVKGDASPNQEQCGDRKNQEAVLERKIDQGMDHCYCSTVLCNTSAFATTLSPGLTPDFTSCMLLGSIFPPITSARRKWPSCPG